MLKDGLVTIAVSDLQPALEFYTGALELRLVERTGDEWAVIEVSGGLRLGLYPGGSAGFVPGSPAGVTVGFYVTGRLDDTVAELRRRGVQVEAVEPMPEVSTIRRAWFTDPDGNLLFIAERLEPW